MLKGNGNMEKISLFLIEAEYLDLSEIATQKNLPITDAAHESIWLAVSVHYKIAQGATVRFVNKDGSYEDLEYIPPSQRSKNITDVTAKVTPIKRRITLTLNKAEHEDIFEMATQKNLSITDAIHESIWLAASVHYKITQGCAVRFVNKDESYQELEYIPPSKRGKIISITNSEKQGFLLFPGFPSSITPRIEESNRMGCGTAGDEVGDNLPHDAAKFVSVPRESAGKDDLRMKRMRAEDEIFMRDSVLANAVYGTGDYTCLRTSQE